MDLLFVKRNAWGSRLIRWATNSEASHFAVAFDEGGYGIVFHSGPRGTELRWMTEFLEDHQVVHKLRPLSKLGLLAEEEMYRAVLRTEYRRAYDWPAIAWWAWRALLRKVLKIPLPQRNQWQNPHWRICTGIAPAVMRELGIPLWLPDAEMVDLDELYRSIMASGRFMEGV
jgi:hypothetical protein